MKLLVARHGLTQTNKDQVINGRLDEPLTEEGKRQAKELAEKLRSAGIEAIYSSPLKRTSMTALPIAEKINVEINIDRRIIEVDVGRFQGQPDTMAEKEFGCKISGLLDTYSYDFRDSERGESSEQVEARIRSFIEDLKETPYKCVLVVTHGGIVRWFSYICTGQKIGRQPNAKVLEYAI